LDSGSKPLVVVELGAEGWQVGMSGEVRKTEDGITLAVADKLEI